MAAKRPKINRDFFKKKPNLNYKYFLWAAVGLVILVVITPLLTHRRSDKGEKILPETGVVVKEIPRSSLPGAETARPMQGVDSSVGFKEGDLQPGTAETQVTQQEGQAEQPSTLALQEGTAAVPAGPQAQQAQIASPAETLPQQTAQADALLKGVAGDPIESQSEQVQTASLPPAQMQSAALPTAATQQSAAAPSTEDESAAEAPQETPVQGTATPTQQASLAQRSQPRKASVKPAT
ncbi:MAG: hypothetical protein RBS57_08815, partial [Desulforhabdus sp.]|nr:hypothetical protein [Desulforhabdus sp.]